MQRLFLRTPDGNMKPKIYIDGKEGTTGLQIYERLGKRDDLDLLLIDEAKRKDAEERKKFLNAADIVFLCLPDAAAREAVGMIENDRTRVIDASTAHRTAAGWDYGFAELSTARRTAIAQSKRVANPGCHASGRSRAYIRSCSTVSYRQISRSPAHR